MTYSLALHFERLQGTAFAEQWAAAADLPATCYPSPTARLLPTSSNPLPSLSVPPLHGAGTALLPGTATQLAIHSPNCCPPTFWCRRCTEQSRSNTYTALPCPSANTCTCSEGQARGTRLGEAAPPCEHSRNKPELQFLLTSGVQRHQHTHRLRTFVTSGKPPNSPPRCGGGGLHAAPTEPVQLPAASCKATHSTRNKD